MAPSWRELHDMSFDSLPADLRVWNGPSNSYSEGLGRLILLTPAVVKAASACIITGQRACMNWSMDKLEVANFNRQPSQHHIVTRNDGRSIDDIYIFNPQQSSQWDGLRHYSQPSPSPDNPSHRVFYGGVERAEIMDRSNTRIGMQHWARQGICGRGVLLDYVEYAKRHGITYTALSDHSVSLAVLQDMAREQKVTCKRGDILFVRVGMTIEWDQMTFSDKTAYGKASSPQHAGIEGTKDMLRWIWDQGFAAVASDSASMEVFPPPKKYVRPDGAEVDGLFMHETLLAGWGMPIGELFDLEELTRLCQEQGRWHFFVSSSPLNMPGGASTPPNCMAIF